MHRVLDLCPLSHRLFYLRGGVGLVFTKLLKGLLCAGVRFEGCNVLTSVLLFRHPSIAGEAAGGIQVLFFLKGCDSVGG